MTFVFGLLPDWVSTTQLPDWSLSLEMQFYLVFPLLSLASIRFGALRVGAVIVPIFLLATKLWAKHFPEPSLLLFKLPVFYVGILLFYSVVAADKNKRTCLTFGAVILTFTQVQFYGYRACWLAVLTFPIVLIGQELGQGRWAAFQFWLRRILDNRVTELSSEWSYSVYLFHGFFISILGSALFRSSTFLECSKLAKLGIFFTVVLLGTVLVSMFVYYLVERPFIELGKLLISRFEQRRARISTWSPNE
jgi:peptidoglycan/LPS O-acetylase OafA/YrhL